MVGSKDDGKEMVGLRGRESLGVVRVKGVVG